MRIGSINDLLDVMAKLRDPERGCPWDVEQTFDSIAPYTLEEAYEVVDAIERNDWPNLREELGDLLLQVVFHARMAEEKDLFNFHDVADSIHEKMIRRHPHVFGERQIATADEQKIAWEQVKEEERKKKSKTDSPHRILNDIPKALPALVLAEKVQSRAARVGFDWDSPEPVYEKVQEELSELHQAADAQDAPAIEEELGDLLFAAVNLSRTLKVDPEQALRKATHKFRNRFEFIEDALLERGEDMSDKSIGELEALWQQAKAR